MGQGDSFGELALMIDSKGLRQARIQCCEDCYLGVINAVDYNKGLRKIEQRKRDNLLEFLRDIPYFKYLKNM